MTHLTYLLFTPSSELISENGHNWKRIKSGFYIGEYLQYAVDSAVIEASKLNNASTPKYLQYAVDRILNRQADAPPFPADWNEMDIRFFLFCLNAAYFSLLPPPYFLGAFKSQGAKQNLVHLEREGGFAWDDVEKAEQVDFMPGLNFSNGNGLGFSTGKRKKRIGFLDGLMKVWNGSVLGGKGVIAGPAFNGKTIGWASCCFHQVQFAVAEVFFLVNYNIRKLKLCPKCGKFHWENGHIVCRDCRNKYERKRRANKEKTPKDKFLNKVYQTLTRKGIKEERQRKEVLEQINNSFAQEGLEAAERVFRKILDDIKK